MGKNNVKNNDKKQISTQEKRKKNFEIENVSIDYHMFFYPIEHN